LLPTPKEEKKKKTKYNIQHAHEPKTIFATHRREFTGTGPLGEKSAVDAFNEHAGESCHPQDHSAVGRLAVSQVLPANCHLPGHFAVQ